MNYSTKVILLMNLLLASACGVLTTRPKQEMSYAQVAYLAAKEVQADSKAPVLFRKAEFYYLRAKSAYKRKYFNKALELANLSRSYSERAEYIAVQKQMADNLNSAVNPK